MPWQPVLDPWLVAVMLTAPDPPAPKVNAAPVLKPIPPLPVPLVIPVPVTPAPVEKVLPMLTPCDVLPLPPEQFRKETRPVVPPLGPVVHATELVKP